MPLSKETLDCMYIEDKQGKKIMVKENALNAIDSTEYLFKIPVELKDGEKAIALALNCNDIFWWATAELEFISYDDIESLYNYCFDENGKEKPYGSLIWVCLKRKMRPQHPWEDLLKERGYWTPELEALPERDFTG